MVKILSRRSLGVLLSYDDVEYYIIESKMYAPFMSKSSGKIGLLFHKLLIEDITKGIDLKTLTEIIDEININKKIGNEIFTFLNLDYNDKEGLYLRILENVKHAENILKRFSNKFTRCEKVQSYILGMRIVGEPDLCVSDAVFEVKTRFNFKKSDIIQALVYTYLYNTNSYLFLYDAFMKNYQILLVPISKRNFELLMDIVRRVSDYL